MTRWRHKKRGTTYVEIGRGRLQLTDTPHDMADLVLYRAEEDGSLWARPVPEFEDGRFERLDDGPFQHLEEAIKATFAVAERLELLCPASQADSKAEDLAHTLIHSLNDAAIDTERALAEIMGGGQV